MGAKGCRAGSAAGLAGGVIPTYTLLALAIGALWAGGDERSPGWRRQLWLLPLGASVVTALVVGVVRPVGLVWLVGLAAALWRFFRPGAGRAQLAVLAGLILLLALGLMLHRLPGFENPRVIFARRFTPDALPFTLYLNFDKTAAGLLILGWGHSRMTQGKDWRAMARLTVPWAAGIILVIMVLSLVSGYVRFEPKFPPETWLWLGVNLGFTCFAEETLFRGFIQAQLQRLWKNLPGGQWFALMVAAVLFGLAHANGGAAYVVLTMIAGLGYGWIYQSTRRIEASILTHFSLNAVHFFFFTYPALQK
jgi:membrane protease YdiL (CAAX protease family)